METDSASVSATFMRLGTRSLDEGKLHVTVVSQHHDDTQLSSARYLIHTCDMSFLVR